MLLFLSGIFIVASHILEGVDSLEDIEKAKMRAISIAEKEQEQSVEF